MWLQSHAQSVGVDEVGGRPMDNLLWYFLKKLFNNSNGDILIGGNMSGQYRGHDL
jgi:hypothetical protein